MILAVGKIKKADLVALPVVLWEKNQSISSEIATVTENLNYSVLITPSKLHIALSKHYMYGRANGNSRAALRMHYEQMNGGF